MMEFIQAGPSLENTYIQDPFLQSYLQRVLPVDILKRIEPGLISLGFRSAHEILELGYQAEAEIPQHVSFDAWGKRVDQIKVADAWKNLGRIAVEEKLIATAYRKAEGPWSRVHQMVRIYLYGPSAALYTCPLAMSDGAARALEIFGSDELKKTAFRNLISEDVNHFWTSGQWMTEKTGGSDVSLTSTVAKKVDGVYKLFGTKWFTSATTSEMAMTLARTENALPGSRGLSLFFLRLRNDSDELNQITIHRLKNKLGTKALPTAELSLHGAVAECIAGEGNGVKKISTLFNITRIWNACTAASFMRRGQMLASDYANKRTAFGKKLSEHALHQETLAELKTECDAAFLLVMRVAELLGKDETDVATNQEVILLRLLTPLAKLYTAKQSIAVASEVLESFGGAGYIEDTHLPRLLRDSQVLAIWEGTTNVLSLDVLRVIQKENALNPFFNEIESSMLLIQNPKLAPFVSQIRKSALDIAEYFKSAPSESDLNKNARGLSFAMAEVFMSSLILIQTAWVLNTEPNDTECFDLAKRWNKKLRFSARVPSVDEKI